MSPQVGAAIVGFGAAIVGGGIQSFVSWLQNTKQAIRNARQRDYAVFIEAIAAMSQAKMGTPERTRATALSIEAKAKILLYGSPKVILALEQHSKHIVLLNEESFEDFCRLIEAMREDVGGTNVSSFISRSRAILFEPWRARS